MNTVVWEVVPGRGTTEAKTGFMYEGGEREFSAAAVQHEIVAIAAGEFLQLLQVLRAVGLAVVKPRTVPLTGASSPLGINPPSAQ